MKEGEKKVAAKRGRSLAWPGFAGVFSRGILQPQRLALAPLAV
jgi:hypothetical protein